MNKTFTLATLHNVTGSVSPLDLPLMPRNQAERHAQQLRKLMPNVQIFTINTKAE